MSELSGSHTGLSANRRGRRVGLSSVAAGAALVLAACASGGGTPNSSGNADKHLAGKKITHSAPANPSPSASSESSHSPSGGSNQGLIKFNRLGHQILLKWQVGDNQPGVRCIPPENTSGYAFTVGSPNALALQVCTTNDSNTSPGKILGIAAVNGPADIYYFVAESANSGLTGYEETNAGATTDPSLHNEPAAAMLREVSKTAVTLAA